MEKPISLAIDQFQSDIINTINSCELHPSIMVLSLKQILKDLESETNNIKEREYFQYQASLKEQQVPVEEPILNEDEEISEELKDREPISVHPDVEEIE